MFFLRTNPHMAQRPRSRRYSLLTATLPPSTHFSKLFKTRRESKDAAHPGSAGWEGLGATPDSSAHSTQHKTAADRTRGNFGGVVAPGENSHAPLLKGAGVWQLPVGPNT